MMYLKAQEVVKGLEVLASKFWVKLGDEFLNETRRGTCDDNIIHVH